MIDVEPVVAQWADRIRPHLAQAVECVLDLLTDEDWACFTETTP